MSRNKCAFGGVDFETFSCYVAKSNYLDGPAKDVEQIDVPGRSGSLYISNDRYKNFNLKVQIYITENMRDNMDALRHYLESCWGYQRYSEDLCPNEFRMASFNEMFVAGDTDAKRGVSTLVFNCKPQRFLKSGETPVPSASTPTTYTGNPVSINNPSGLSTVSSLAVALNPVQDLHGYESPWVGGAGKNKLPLTIDGIKTASGGTWDGNTCSKDGVTFTIQTDNNGNVTGILANGTATQNTFITVYSTPSDKTIPNGNYIVSGVSGGSTTSYFMYGYRLNSGTSATITNNDVAVTVDSSQTYNLSCQIVSGYTANNVLFKPMIRPSTVSDSTWEPYENICPIIAANGKNLFDKDNANILNAYINGSSAIVGSGVDRMVCIPVLANKTFSVAFTQKALVTATQSDDMQIGLFDSTPVIGLVGTRIYSAYRTAPTADMKVTYTGSTSSHTWLAIKIGNTNRTDVQASMATLQIEYGNATSYQPYHGISVERTGKNLLPNQNVIKSGNNYFLCATSNDFPIHLKAGTYTIQNKGVQAYCYGMKQGGSSFTIHNGATHTGTFTVTEEGNYKFWYYQLNVDETQFYDNMLEVGTEATSYEPYTGTSYPYTLGQNVYGGTVDLATGVLTVTHGYVDLGSLSWTLQSLDRWKSNDLTNVLNPTDNYSKCGAISDRYVEYAITELNSDSRIGFSVYQSRFYLRNGSTSITPTGTVVYPLESPTTVQLTPQQISLLTGVNVISSSDEVTVTVTEPSLLVNPTLFESKPLIRVYGTGTITINNQYITISAHSFPYIDIDCELMDAFYGASNANQYVAFSTTDYVTLRAGNNYVAYTGGTLEITPRWFEI